MSDILVSPTLKKQNQRLRGATEDTAFARTLLILIAILFLLLFLFAPLAVVFVEATAKGLSDRKSTRLNSSHIPLSRMPSSA